MLLKKINKVMGYISGVIFLITAIVMLYDILVRYIVGSPSLWASSVSSYLILAGIFLGTAYCMRTGGHVNVDIILDAVKNRTAKKIMLTIGYVFSLIYVGLMFYYIVDTTILALSMDWYTAFTFSIPAGILYIIMDFGALMLWLTILSMLISLWKTDRDVDADDSEESNAEVM